MAELIKLLSEVGFSPLSIALAVALGVLWKTMVARDVKQTTDRESWHAETRAQVVKLEQHTKQCDDDRANLRGQVEVLSKSCHRSDCPRRLQ